MEWTRKVFNSPSLINAMPIALPHRETQDVHQVPLKILALYEICDFLLRGET